MQKARDKKIPTAWKEKKRTEESEEVSCKIGFPCILLKSLGNLVGSPAFSNRERVNGAVF